MKKLKQELTHPGIDNDMVKNIIETTTKNKGISLNLSGCKLTSVPKSIGNLVNLQELS